MKRPHTREEHPAVAFALRALGARKGPPTEADGPVRRSRPPDVIPGQMDIFEVIDAGETLEKEGEDEVAAQRERVRQAAAGVAHNAELNRTADAERARRVDTDKGWS